jgi:hypothetical protein
MDLFDEPPAAPHDLASSAAPAIDLGRTNKLLFVSSRFRNVYRVSGVHGLGRIIAIVVFY